MLRDSENAQAGNQFGLTDRLTLNDGPGIIGREACLAPGRGHAHHPMAVGQPPHHQAGREVGLVVGMTPDTQTQCRDRRWCRGSWAPAFYWTR